MSARSEARIVAIELGTIGALMLSAALYRRYGGRPGAAKPAMPGAEPLGAAGRA